MASRTEVRQPLVLVPIGDRVDAELVRELRRGLEEALSVELSLGDPITLEADAAEPVASAELIDRLIERSAEPDHWYLGVTAADLDAPARRWVFGEATQGGRWALISVARFGAPESPGPRMRDRTIKEALHEIGHLAGLPHCENGDCVMTTAPSVAAVDAKNSKFCPACRTRLGDLSRA